jgi:hypothetical protein
MPPPLPAGTITALAVMVPVGAFKVDVAGCGCPAGHVLSTQSAGPRGTAVKLNEYAFALAEISQEPR